MASDQSSGVLGAENDCIICGQPEAKRCSQCISTSYCSRVCQKKDFAAHKHLCKEFATVEARPSPQHRRAIFFPESEDTPRPIWVKCNTTPVEKWTADIKGETDPHLGADHPTPEIARITHNPVRDVHFGAAYERLRPAAGGYCVSRITRKQALIDGSDENKSLITATKPVVALARPYLGNMLAVRELSEGTRDDITLADFRHLIDHLITAEEAAAATREHPRGMVLHGFMQFAPMDVDPEQRRSLGPDSIPPLSVLVGMPIRMWKLLMSGFRDTNVESAYLQINLDPANPSFGWVPMA
ncbi:hypothetical protein BJY01DRAFT_255110 [Aspergillus pseudoustus]|uniref:MYND-type domain-containing protein n=1 Tax=Aspergillus pseudoustus TaxID=1810923 RepID=A0ABR4IQM2_9EURO